MTKQTVRTIRTLDLTRLAAATGGMNISLTPKTTASSGSSTSSGQTSVITGPTTSTGSGTQIASVIQ